MNSQLLGHSTPPSQSNDQSRTHSAQPGQLNNPIPPFPPRNPPSPGLPPPDHAIQIGFQSLDHPLPPPSPPLRTPWFRWNEFVAMELATHGPLPHEFHKMDPISLCVLNYFFACGLSYTSTWSQRPNLNTSIHIQCFLNQAAFSLFLLANAVFPRTRPVLAFVLDRLSFLLIVISAYLASMPMFPPYFAITMLLIVIIVYIFARFRG